jgi:esterase/lipase
MINIKIVLIYSSSLLGLYYFYNYKQKCIKNTFDRLDKIFIRRKKWEKELDIYKIAMPIYHISEKKKKKCLLLIGGFRDIPYVWNELEKYLKKEKLDYYAPRTFGKGRCYIQETSYKDWIITYLEAIYLLQNQYEEINIVAFSAGSLIALYLSQYKWNCKINNLVLCAPFIYKELSVIDKLCDNYWWSPIIYNIISLLVPYKESISKKGYLTCRNTHNSYYALYDFYEPILILQQGREILKLLEHIHKNIFDKNTKLEINKLVTIYPNDDRIIGDPEKQLLLLNKIHKTNIIRYNLPSNKINKQCGHVIFKEDREIINELWNILNKYL